MLVVEVNTNKDEDYKPNTMHASFYKICMMKICKENIVVDPRG